jgi:hypothetical protein
MDNNKLIDLLISQTNTAIVTPQQPGSANSISFEHLDKLKNLGMLSSTNTPN